MNETQGERTLEQLLLDAAQSLFPMAAATPRIAIDTRSSTGDTALHVFLWRGDEPAARALVRFGADVNAVGEMGEAPLHVAVRLAGPRTLAALVAAGARTDVISEFGQTPQELAEEMRRLPVFKEALALARSERRGDEEARLNA